MSFTELRAPTREAGALPRQRDPTRAPPDRRSEGATGEAERGQDCKPGGGTTLGTVSDARRVTRWGGARGRGLSRSTAGAWRRRRGVAQSDGWAGPGRERRACGPGSGGHVTGKMAVFPW